MAAIPSVQSLQHDEGLDPAIAEALAPSVMTDANPPLLTVSNLRVTFEGQGGDIHAVRDVSLDIRPGERVVALGESGSGKTMTAMSILGLQPAEAAVSGRLAFAGQEPQPVAIAAERVMHGAGVVFQDSLSSLNPVIRIGDQLVERLTLRGWKRPAASNEAIRVLAHVGVPDPARRMKSYPHELSGGMRQRVMICMALLTKPSLLVADEPTTALDTTVQAQVIDLIRAIQDETGMALLLITHDIALAAEVCDRAIVMYAGYIVETGPMADIVTRPRHPYTRALLHAMPRLDSPRDVPLEAIRGEPPSARQIFTHCPFKARCPEAVDACDDGVPELVPVSDARAVRCVRHDGRQDGRRASTAA